MVVLGLAAVAACSTNDPISVEFCPEGTTAVVGGCLPIARGDAAVDGPIDSGSPDAETGDSGAIADSGVALGRLNGRWAVELTTPQVVSNPVLGDDTRTRMTFFVLALSDFGQPTAAAQVTLCAVRAEPFAGITTTYPAAAISGAVPYSALEVLADVDGFEIAGLGYLLGWTSEMPRLGDVPVESDDPAVRDSDNDGNPGVTLQVTGDEVGQIYVASRTEIALDGRLTAPDTVAGTSQLTQEQQIVGASDNAITREETTFAQNADANTNTFRMLRLVDDDDCATALSRF